MFIIFIATNTIKNNKLEEKLAMKEQLKLKLDKYWETNWLLSLIRFS